MGRGFEATVELLLQQSGQADESVNEVDASVIIIEEDELLAQRKARPRSGEEGPDLVLSGSEKLCLEELKGVVAAVSGVIGSSSSSSSSKSDEVLQRIAR